MNPNFHFADQQTREELVRSNLALQDGSHGPLVAALRGANANLANSYVVNWIPEQAQDIYTVLIEMGTVLIVEIPRDGSRVQIERQELSNFEAECSRVQRRKIAVAKELSFGTTTKADQ